MAIITAEVKDLVLLYLVNNYEIGVQRLVGGDLNIHGVTGSTVIGIIEHFGRIGLVECESMDTDKGIFLLMSIKVEAHDFQQKGGFFGHYELFQKNVEKLLWQVERLEKIDGPQQIDVVDIGRKISEYVSLIGNLVTIGTSVVNSIDPGGLGRGDTNL